MKQPKRSILTVMLMTVAFLFASARHISPQEAASAAESFLNRTISGAVQKSLRKPKSVSMPQRPFYVFNADDGNGFVIIAADDRVPRVIGYSESGVFDTANIPPQLIDLLDRYAGQINSIPASAPTHRSWLVADYGVDDEGVLLKTADWGQKSPYNSMCPTIEGQKAPTGCVATAMAIAMNYNKWPERYDWDSMPTGNVSESNAGDLPLLMKDAGESVFMNYGEMESGAFVYWVGQRLRYVFGYSPECQYITAENFTDSEWHKMLRENLDNRQVVIYNGVGSDNHAFVVDGYVDCVDENKDGSLYHMYHINWGWDGAYNGYFTLDNLAPGNGGYYSENAGMVINIRPDRSGKEYSECFCDNYFNGYGDRRSMMVNVDAIRTGEEFAINAGFVVIPPGFKGTVGIGLVSETDNIKQVIIPTPARNDTKERKECFIGGYGVVFTEEVNAGDRIQFVAKSDSEPEYKLVPGTLEYPSWKSVTGIVPDISRVKWTIDENIAVKYQANYEGYNSRWVELYDGDEIEELTSSNISTEISLINENLPEGNVYCKVVGRGVYWDINVKTAPKLLRNTFCLLGKDYEVIVGYAPSIDKEVHLAEAGSLSRIISEDEALKIRNLRIDGEMNAKDFWYIRDNMHSLKTLDIADVGIVATEAEDELRFPGIELKCRADYLPDWALEGLRHLEIVELPEKLKGLGSSSLSVCNLQKIVIPEGVTFIDTNVFFMNQQLKVVEVRNPEPVNILECIFTDTQCPSRGYLYVPAGSKAAYENAPVWKDFAEIIEGRSDETAVFVQDGLQYEKRASTVSVTGYVGEPENISFPVEVVYNNVSYPVVSIDDGAFSRCIWLKTVTMPEDSKITRIGSCAFNGCTELTEVKLGPKVTDIGMGAFSNTNSLEEVDLKNVVNLGGEAFAGSGIKRVFIPSGLRHTDTADLEIGESFFISCFYSNVRLAKFEVAEDNPNFKSVDGILYNTQGEHIILESVPCLYSGDVVNIAEGTEWVNSESVANVSGQIGKLVFPETIKQCFNYFFRGNSGIKHLVLPSGALLGEMIFNSGLEAVTFSSQPVSRLDKLFSDCPDLKYIYFNTVDPIRLDEWMVSGIYESPTLFTASLVPHISYSGPGIICIPGAASKNYSGENYETAEMWHYAIDRDNGKISVVPCMKGVIIAGVSINGTDMPVSDNYAYDYPVDEGDPEVIVRFNLHGRQDMTAIYPREFNLGLESTGVESVAGGQAVLCDVYNISGCKILNGCRRSDIDRLPSGIYIVRQGIEVFKYCVK